MFRFHENYNEEIINKKEEIQGKNVLPLDINSNNDNVDSREVTSLEDLKKILKQVGQIGKIERIEKEECDLKEIHQKLEEIYKVDEKHLIRFFGATDKPCGEGCLR